MPDIKTGLIGTPRSFGLLGTLVLTLACLCWPASEAHAQAWSLSTAQRQAYLSYYAPIVLKRANGNDGRHGYDWITNFNFDQDGDFSNNKLNWKNIDLYVDASRAGPNAYYERWRIRPTLYTSLIEFTDGGSKSLVLIYHIYHALDKNAAGDYQLHDWERVEMLIRNVTGSPGTGETFAHAVVTQHKRNVIRPYGTAQPSFMQTSTGKHLLIWQAEWSDKLLAPHGQELRFVEDSWAWLSSQMATGAKAQADVNNDDGRKNLHYAFVPQGSAGAVSAFGAEALSYATADRLASRSDNGTTVTWPGVKRVTYELQDLADILPTHWQYGGYATHWLTTTPVIDVWMESPILNEAAGAEVSSGMQRFFAKTRDIENEDDREGYIAKKWFFGTYELNSSASDSGGGGSGAFHDAAYASTGVDSRGQTRASASGYPTSPNAFWWQHDYFVHSGTVDSTDGVESGFWLPGYWYLPQNGGFDGRWVQLFAD